MDLIVWDTDELGGQQAPKDQSYLRSFSIEELTLKEEENCHDDHVQTTTNQNDNDNAHSIYPILPLSNSHGYDQQPSVLHFGEQHFEEIRLDEKDDFSNDRTQFDRNSLAQDHSPKLQNVGQNTIRPAVNNIVCHSSEDRLNPSKELPLLLINNKEQLTIETDIDFMRQLHTDGNDPSVKCVSIIGNTGDGKSYTLNELFFSGQEKFRTSSTSDSCTLGVWAALDEHQRTLVLDTEGRLGLSQNDNVRNRLLLKILCISDIIIYRTRAPKLPNDMFQFLSDASNAFHKYFRRELESVMKSCQMDGPMSTVGPTLIVFHETQHTEVLRGVLETQKTPVEQLKERFEKMKLSYDAYSWIEYVGTQTTGGKPTDFSELRATVMSILDNNKVRSPRRLSIIFRALKALNEKFNHNIPPEMPSTLPDDFFACCIKCRSCGAKCTMTANHQKENIAHECSGRCTYNRELDNEVWKCLQCHRAGQDTTVYGKLITKNDGLVQGLIRYMWSGFVIECPHHGEIYRSRKHWYGNSDPKDVTCIEIVHVWPGDNNNRVASDVTPRKLLDAVCSTASGLRAPVRNLLETVTDQIAPAYWTPNKDATECSMCSFSFGYEFSKHHCRACGKIFCDACSNYRAIVPDSAIKNPERVCFNCFTKLRSSWLTPIYHSNQILHESIETNSYESEEAPLSAISPRSVPVARRVLEIVRDTVGTTVYQYPFEVIKQKLQPSYWRADDECSECFICRQPFNTTSRRLHHCRKCGECVCDSCSPGRYPVPERDWFAPERVCKTCEQEILRCRSAKTA